MKKILSIFLFLILNISVSKADEINIDRISDWINSKSSILGNFYINNDDSKELYIIDKYNISINNGIITISENTYRELHSFYISFKRKRIEFIPKYYGLPKIKKFSSYNITRFQIYIEPQFNNTKTIIKYKEIKIGQDFIDKDDDESECDNIKHCRYVSGSYRNFYIKVNDKKIYNNWTYKLVHLLGRKLSLNEDLEKFSNKFWKNIKWKYEKTSNIVLIETSKKDLSRRMLNAWTTLFKKMGVKKEPF